MGGNVQMSKDTITELYKNLSFKILSRVQHIEIKKISELSARLNFKMKRLVLLNLERQDKDTKKNHQDVNNTYEFYKNVMMRTPLKSIL